MRMSMRDIKQEVKESEGDPYVKAQRRQLAQQLSQQNATNAARNANVLVVNPTHIAIAIDYDRELNPVPTIAAKGEDHVALAMRQAAEEAGVPIVRNIPLARDLFARSEVGEIIPSDLFDVIAEVILWAREVRQQVDAQRRGELLAAKPDGRRMPAPGEDLTHYLDQPDHSAAPPPETPWNRSP
jgi:type III secretion protein U